MAIGFNPKHTEEFPLVNLTSSQYIALAISAAESLDWNVFDASRIGFKADTGGGVFSSTELIKVRIIGDTVNVESSTIGGGMVDFGKNKENVNKLIIAANELQVSLSIDELRQKYQTLVLLPDDSDELQQEPASSSQNFRSFLSLFIPQEGYFITPILLNLNILIFIAMISSGVNVFAPDNESLIDWGANFTPLTLGTQPWRLLTSCFLHIGIIHLLMNMYALTYIGVLLEPYLGKTRFTSAYLLTGIAASVTSLWWHDITISAGASGAIFGMYGVFLALLTTDFIHKDMRKNLLTSITVFVGYNLLYGMKGGIDNAAHIGGLLSGIVIGYALIPSLKKPEAQKLKLISIALLAIIIFSTSFAVYNRMPNDIAEYERRIKPFANNELRALEIYELPENTSKSRLLSEIKDSGIFYWNKNIKLLKEMEKLDLPDVLDEKNVALRKYCELRIKSYELLYKMVDEDNNEKYMPEIQSYNQQIEVLIKELGGENSTR